MVNGGRTAGGAADPKHLAELDKLQIALNDLLDALTDGKRLWFGDGKSDTDVERDIMVAADGVSARLADSEHLIPADLLPSSPARPEAIRETLSFLSPVWGLPGRGEDDLRALMVRVEMAREHVVGNKSRHDPITGIEPANTAGSTEITGDKTGRKSNRARRIGGRDPVLPREAEYRHNYVEKWNRVKKAGVALTAFLEREGVKMNQHRAWVEWVRNNPRRKPT